MERRLTLRENGGRAKPFLRNRAEQYNSAVARGVLQRWMRGCAGGLFKKEMVCNDFIGDGRSELNVDFFHDLQVDNNLIID